jgi:hypothetical protein
MPINNKINALPNNGNAPTPGNGTTVGKIVTLPNNGNTAPLNNNATGKIVTLPVQTNGTTPPNGTGGGAGKIVTLPVQTINKPVAIDTLKSKGPNNKIVETPIVKQELKTEFKVDRRDDRVVKLNNNGGQFNANGGGNRLQGNTLALKPSSGTNNSAPRFVAMGGGGGFGHHH